jgi:hypothetical protein
MRSTLQPLARAASTAKWGVSARTAQSARGGSSAVSASVVVAITNACAIARGPVDGGAFRRYASRIITTLTGRCDMTSVMWPLPVVFPVSRKTPTSVEHLHIFDAFPPPIGLQSQFLKLLALH